MENQDLDILRKVRDEGEERQTRNSVTRSLFGVRMEFDISQSFPLLTTKRMYWKGIAKELLWFLRADTNATRLSDQGVRIWDGNTTREFLDSRGLQQYREGECGPIYGFQWRHFNAEYRGSEADYTNCGVDQLQNCIDLIRNDPTSRRIFMSGWNPCQLDEMCLPPCHVSYQFYVSKGTHLCCQMYQRSGDLFLGVPFNIASTSLLTYLVAKTCGLQPGKVVIVIGDAHIYDCHLEQVNEQLSRTPKYDFPQLNIKRNCEKVEDYTFDDLELVNYKCDKSIRAKMIA